MAKKSKPARKQKPKAAPGQTPKPAATTREPDEKPGHKIFPRNLTARADYLVPGNPIVTRPEDAVANCFPGLELDVRNLDRRFFPGLVFNFVTPGGAEVKGMHYGAKLAYVDVPLDPDLGLDPDTAARLFSTLGIERNEIKELFDNISDEEDTLSEGAWYLDWIKQGKRRLSTKSLDGHQVWRLLRGLEPGRVEIALRQREGEHRGAEVRLKGWRRLYTDPTTGVISGAYEPGELMQGLCSPWQHDFRDCACHYWPANHPDVVLGEIYPGEPTLPGGSTVESSRNVRLDWLREDRSIGLASAALNTISLNRPYQIDHFRINSNWQDLSIIVEGREIGALYVPTAMENANPYGSVAELVNELQVWLAPLELTLICEYLYARSSVLTFEEVQESGGDPALANAVDFVRYSLLLIATSEMHHLRWANELLWKVCNSEHLPFKPVLEICDLVPKSPLPPGPVELTMNTVGDFVRTEQKLEFHPRQLKTPTKQALAEFQRNNPGADPGFRERALRPLAKTAVDDFIALEHPSSFIDGAYARVIATLRRPEFPDQLSDLAMRIASDGMEHESHFIDIKAALAPFEEAEYLRPNMQIGTQTQARGALAQFDKIIDSLTRAYHKAGHDELETSNPDISAARAAMNELLRLGENLAKFGTEAGTQATKSIGIPYFSRWDSSSASTGSSKP